jgi:hypothetical protein
MNNSNKVEQSRQADLLKAQGDRLAMMQRSEETSASDATLNLRVARLVKQAEAQREAEAARADKEQARQDKAEAKATERQTKEDTKAAIIAAQAARKAQISDTGVSQNVPLPELVSSDARTAIKVAKLKQQNAAKQEQAQATLDSVLMSDKGYKNLFEKYNKLSNDAYELELKYGQDDKRSQQAWNNAARADLEVSKYRNNSEFQKKLTPYEKALSALYDKFRESEFNPKAMDSTFYKEAQNVKDFYKRTDPNTQVDVVPLYGDKKLMQRKLKGMTPFDKFAIFGHSGDRLAGIDNNDIAKYLSESRVEDCYFGSCGFESHIKDSDLKYKS